MGANVVQAQGLLAFLIAFVLIAAAAAVGGTGSMLLLAMGIVALAVSAALFRKCKPWEHREE